MIVHFPSILFVILLNDRSEKSFVQLSYCFSSSFEQTISKIVHKQCRSFERLQEKNNS